jgi:hypothetical protein
MMQEDTGMDAPYLVPILQAHDPQRPLDWRWQRAEHLVGLPGRPARDDPETTAATAYLRVEQYGGRRPPARSRTAWPAIRAAQKLAGCDEQSRAEVESRILAGQNDLTIANRCSLPSEVVHWYEALFYCVRDRLGARDWIITRAIGVGLSTGIGDRGAVWRSVGYFGGPEALDAMIAATAGSPIGVGESNHTSAATSVDPVHESARLLAAALLLPPDTKMAQLAGLQLQLRRLEAMTRTQTVAERVAERVDCLHEPLPRTPVEVPRRVATTAVA